MNDADRLLTRLETTPYPPQSAEIGDFELWTSILTGYLDRIASGEPLDEPAALIMQDGADDETKRYAGALESKAQLAPHELLFLTYWRVLEEARLLVLAAATR